MSLALDLSGQTALVTGCKRGIGLAVCRTLAEAGADIIGVSASLEAQGSAAETAVRSAGRRFTARQCDFSDRDATLAFAGEMEQRGDISILVNNAGTIRRSPAAEHPLADWDHVQAVNCDAPFILTQALGRSMLVRGSGKDRLCRFGAELSGRHQCAGLCRQQGRDRADGAGVCQ